MLNNVSLGDYIHGSLCFISNAMLSRESEGSFHYGNYWREADDLRAVVQYFCGANRAVGAILGHSKGVLDYSKH